MKIDYIDNNVIVSKLKDFDLFQTMDCGQCFNYEVIDTQTIAIVANKRLVIAKQPKVGELILLDMTKEEFENYFVRYFDLNRDYEKIKKELLKNDKLLKSAIDSMSGVRILNQDFVETLISFIISQNNQIPHIKTIVRGISRKYGEYVGSVGEKEFYAFPDIEQLSRATDEELRELKAGFRAPYILDAINKCMQGVITKKELQSMSTKECINKLMEIKGVGTKVANCVALFSLEKRDTFPVDVWIKRIMEDMYFKEDTKKEIIEEFAKKQYGEYVGYAQQYLFFYGRENNIGKKKK